MDLKHIETAELERELERRKNVPKYHTITPYGAEWEESANRLARSMIDIFACGTCGYAVQVGFCCTNCGSSTPEEGAGDIENII